MSIEEIKSDLKVFDVSNDYRWTLLVVMIMLFHYFMCLATGGALRGKLFNQEFMEKEFGKDHEEATGQKIQKGGYPDHGAGFYAMKLSYADWMSF